MDNEDKTPLGTKDFLKRPNHLRDLTKETLSEMMRANKEVQEALGIGQFNQLKSLASDFNRLKDNFNINEIEKITNQFEDLGINKSELLKIKEPNTNATPLEIKTNVSNIHTETSLKLMQLQIKELQDKPKEKLKYFIYGSIIAMVAALIGVIPDIIEKLQSKPPVINIVFPIKNAKNDESVSNK